jgi:small conductance mechanosensitive channel
MEDQFGIGDTISVNDTIGVVEDLSLRVTRLRSADGEIWYVPNGDIRKVANRSRGWARATVDLPLAVTDQAGLDAAERALAEAASDVARTAPFADACTDPPEVLGVLASDGTTCTVRVALRTTPALRDPLERALRQAVVTRMARDGRWPLRAPPDPPAPPDPS